MPAFDLVVADLSFISQTLVLPAVVPLLKPGGTLLTLVKPQFELQPGASRQGRHRRRSIALYAIVETRCVTACARSGAGSHRVVGLADCRGRRQPRVFYVRHTRWLN